MSHDLVSPFFLAPTLAALTAAGKVFAAVLALSLLFCASPAAAQTGSEWKSAVQKLRGQRDPIAAKLVTWVYAADPDLPAATADMVRFVQSNPDWPRLSSIRTNIEKDIGAVLPPPQIVAWFSSSTPLTFNGLRAYVTALEKTGQAATARAAVQSFWREGTLGKTDTAGFLSAYGNLLSKADRAARADHLIWKERFTEAEHVIPLLDNAQAALMRARISLARLEKGADGALARVPAALMSDEGLVYERMRYRRRKGMDSGALEMLRQKPANARYPEIWWKEINILARREIEKKNFKSAHAIIARHQLDKGPELAQAEFLLGWISLRFMNNATAAYAHFDRLYKNVDSAISRSRGAYWSARAAEKAGDTALTTQWYTVCAQYPSTFYGQLCFEKVYGLHQARPYRDPAADAATTAAFDAREPVRAARMLARIGFAQLAEPFLARLSADARTPQDYYLTARLAIELGLRHYAVQVNKDAQQKLGTFLPVIGYPTLHHVPLQHPEKALVHAITYRESMFNPRARSTAGALGLMQLMPATAQETARKIGENYNTQKLVNDPSFNVLLGSTYLHRMLDRYDNHYPMAIAAYNAGPGNVDRWLREIGDPRHGRIDIIDWIELIPIYETRNYIQRVMEAYYMYRLRFDAAPKTVSAFR